jgi:single-strand DNA-binding protein
MNNLVMLTGNVGQDPDFKVIGGGRAVLKFRMATSDKALEGKEPRTDWHSVVVWGKQAEWLSPVLTKGSKVVVTGKLRSGSYEKNGTKVYTYEVEAMSVEVVTRDRQAMTPAPGAVAPRAHGGGGASAFTSGFDELPDDAIPF